MNVIGIRIISRGTDGEGERLKIDIIYIFIGLDRHSAFIKKMYKLVHNCTQLCFCKNGKFRKNGKIAGGFIFEKPWCPKCQ